MLFLLFLSSETGNSYLRTQRKLPDINLWLAAAKAWLEAQNEPKSIALCRVTQEGFLRLLTQESLMQGHELKVLTNKEASELWAKLAADDRMVFLAEPDGMERRWQSYAAQPSASPKLWMDMRIWRLSPGRRGVS